MEFRDRLWDLKPTVEERQESKREDAVLVAY
jgi:hypothetical protein